MHTTECETHRYHHHGDYSGDVEIVHKATGETVAFVPFDELLLLVAEYRRDVLTRRLEEMSAIDLITGGAL